MPAIPFPQPPLGDGVVALRAWHDEDAPVVAAWAQDPVIVRWSGVPADSTTAAVLAYKARAERDRLAGRSLGLAITDAASGAVLGSCDVRRPERDDPALGEIGYVLAESARGRGVATRAIALLVGWAFAELGLGRVQAAVHPDNPASAAVLRRLGFTREGLLRHYRAAAGARGPRALRGAPGRADRSRWCHVVTGAGRTPGRAVPASATAEPASPSRGPGVGGG